MDQSLALIRFVMQATNHGHLGRAVDDVYINTLESGILIRQSRNPLAVPAIRIATKETKDEHTVSNMIEDLMLCIINTKQNAL